MSLSIPATSPAFPDHLPDQLPDQLPDHFKDRLPLYVGFAATGIGVALPGTILPLLLARWHLHDEGGGRLFLGAFIGSSIGALLITGSRRRSLCAGSALIALASIALSFTPAVLAPFCMTIFGTGLGMTMTTISLLRQQRARDSSTEMVRLNLLWSIGAFCCPVLALRALRSGDIRPILLSLALLFLLLLSWAIARPEGRFKNASVVVPKTATSTRLRDDVSFGVLRKLPGRLVLLVMLTTGVEASFGAWLSTFAQRGGDPFSQIVAAPTCFWAGLLLSRLFWSIYAPAAAERWVIRGSLLLIAISGLVLLDLRHGLPFLLAALCIGFGVGPTYPLLLARALRIRASGLIFFLCGLSSAILPWLTGFVSTHFGSLHTGLLVPVLAAAVMVVTSFTLALPSMDNVDR